MSLCWIAIMAQKLDCDLGALTGIHDGDAVIIQLLAGVLAVQMASCLYLGGIAYRGKKNKVTSSIPWGLWLILNLVDQLLRPGPVLKPAD